MLFFEYLCSQICIICQSIATVGRQLKEEMSKVSKLLQFGLGENLIGIYQIIFNGIAKTQLC